MFKRLTGRNEVAISADDYKFYSPRHKFRHAASISLFNITDIPVKYDVGVLNFNRVTASVGKKKGKEKAPNTLQLRNNEESN